MPIASGLCVLLILTTSSLSAQGLPRTRPESVGMSAERLARIAPTLRDYIERGEIAGAVTLVARHGRVVKLDTAGYADVDAKVPMRPGTIFRIASMTKAVTSVAVMVLVEQGKLLLSDPVSKYLPAFSNPRIVAPTADSGRRAADSLVPAKRDMTVRDLLTHRSGLAYSFIDKGPVGTAYRKAGITDGIATTDLTLAENVDRIGRQPLSFEPGAKWQYGISTDVLGRVVEVVSGQPLDRFFTDQIFTPLRMKDTYFYVPDEKRARLAVPYTRKDGKLQPMRDVERFGNLQIGGVEWRGSRNYFSGGAGLFSTAADYARFLQMLLNGGELDGVRVLSPKTVELMTASATGDLSPSPVAPGVGFGLGFAVITDLGLSGAYGSLGQYSWGGIYYSLFWVDPKEDMIGVLMAQRYPNDDLRIGDAFQTLAYQAILKSEMQRGQNARQ